MMKKKGLLSAAAEMQKAGRGGDTLLAHINPHEARILSSLGGAGTRNPKTGLLEFKYGADTKEGGATGGGAGGSGGDKGRDGGTRAGVGTGGGAHAPKGNQKGKDAYGRDISPKGPAGSGASHYNPKYDTWVARTPIAQRNLLDAVKDYNDRTIMEKIGGFLGIGQVDPTTDPNFNAAKHNAPQSSFDVGGLLASAVGMLTGVPVGTMYDITKMGVAQSTGTNPTFGEVTLDDFGQAPQTGYGSLPGAGPVDSQVDPDEGAWGGFFGGGQTGAGQADGYGNQVGGQAGFNGNQGQGGALGPLYPQAPATGALSPETPTNAPKPPAPVVPGLSPYTQPGYNYQIPGPSPYGYQTPMYNYWGR